MSTRRSAAARDQACAGDRRLAREDRGVADADARVSCLPRYLYDGLGSSLFEAICHLPWYRIADAENSTCCEIHSASILRSWARCRRRRTGAWQRSQARPAAVQSWDSGTGTCTPGGHLVRGAGAGPVLARHGARTRCGDLTGRPTRKGSLASRVRSVHAGRSADLFLGSNIGNFDPAGASRCCWGRAAATPRDFAAHRARPREAGARPAPSAYDDPLGVTAAFNRNLLVRLNRELGGTFDVSGFAHRATWNAAASRMEMHLVSTRRQHARLEAAGLDLTFEEGETIWTESSLSTVSTISPRCSHGQGSGSAVSGWKTGLR